MTLADNILNSAALSEADKQRARAEQAERERDEWRKDFNTLCRALVGDTGLSAIEEAHKLRKLHPLGDHEQSTREDRRG